jgi:hypothetical protein
LGAATTIVNAKVFDGTKSRDWTSVRFADGLITECSAASAAQEGDEVIDAGGGTVLPGLIDAHVHLVPGALAQSLTFGVTTVLDMFSKPDLVAGAKGAGRLSSGRGRRAFLGCRCYRARRAPVDDVRPFPTPASLSAAAGSERRMTASVRSSAASGDPMPRMTPEQEAAYALDFDVSRAACRQPRRKPTTGCWNSADPEPREPVSRADAKAAGRMVIRDAKRALAERRRVFLCRVPAMYDQPMAVGTAGLPGRGLLLVPSRGGSAAQVTRVSERVYGTSCQR